MNKKIDIKMIKRNNKNPMKCLIYSDVYLTSLQNKKRDKKNYRCNECCDSVENSSAQRMHGWGRFACYFLGVRTALL